MTQRRTDRSIVDKTVSRKPIPVTILSGYLGAGKTTLLNTILTHPGGLRIFALVNDFGEINLDAALISQATDDVISLTNGCACCSLGDDLSAAFEDILSNKTRTGLMLSEQAIDAVIIEASGVANLKRLTSSTANYPGFTFNQSVSLIDAQAIRALLRDKFVATTVAEQIASADKLMINRCDEDVGLVTSTLAQPAPPVITAAEFLSHLQISLGVTCLDVNKQAQGGNGFETAIDDAGYQDHQLSSVFIPASTDVNLDQLKLILNRALGRSTVNNNEHGSPALMRLKGTIGSGNKVYEVQLSRSGYDILASTSDVPTRGLQCVFLIANEQLSRQSALITSQLRDWATNQKAQ